MLCIWLRFFFSLANFLVIEDTVFLFSSRIDDYKRKIFTRSILFILFTRTYIGCSSLFNWKRRSFLFSKQGTKENANKWWWRRRRQRPRQFQFQRSTKIDAWFLKTVWFEPIGPVDFIGSRIRRIKFRVCALHSEYTAQHDDNRAIDRERERVYCHTIPSHDDRKWKREFYEISRDLYTTHTISSLLFQYEFLICTRERVFSLFFSPRLTDKKFDDLYLSERGETLTSSR